MHNYRNILVKLYDIKLYINLGVLSYSLARAVHCFGRHMYLCTSCMHRSFTHPCTSLIVFSSLFFFLSLSLLSWQSPKHVKAGPAERALRSKTPSSVLLRACTAKSTVALLPPLRQLIVFNSA